MSEPRTDVYEIAEALATAEQDLKTAWGSLRRLHNVLGEKAVAHKGLLGLGDGDIIAFGGGTPKPPEPEGPDGPG